MSSFISVGANKLGALAIGFVLGIKSILKSTCRSGGTPGKSSGNTSAYSRTMGTSSSFRGVILVSITYTRYARHPFFRHL
jgi:hypothetical protein